MSLVSNGAAASDTSNAAPVGSPRHSASGSVRSHGWPPLMSAGVVCTSKSGATRVCSVTADRPVYGGADPEAPWAGTTIAPRRIELG